LNLGTKIDKLLKNKYIRKGFSKMSKTSAFFISISILTVMFCFSGCSDNSTSPPPGSKTITVNGKVIDALGNALSGLTVSIGDQTTTSAADGSFTLNNIKTPYDLKIISSGTHGLEYIGLTTPSPQALGFGVSATPNSANVTVNVPAAVVPLGKRAIVIFTDTSKIQDGSYIVGPNTNTVFTVDWPGAVTLAGRVIVLVANVNLSGNITGYTVYGEKTYTLNNGSPAVITFGTGDFPINPGNATVSGTVIIPSGYTTPVSSIAMSYVQGSAANSGIAIDISGPSYSFTVPSGLPTGFILYVRGSSSGLGSETTAKLMNVLPGSSGNTLTLDAVPALSTPADFATGIDTNTIFTYSSTSGTGVYLMNVISAGKNFYVLTSGTTAHIPNLAAYGLALGSSVNYQWYVQRLLGVGSTDNFVSSVFLYNTNFVGLTTSTTRHFTSAP
jgi:hypothetical protein